MPRQTLLRPVTLSLLVATAIVARSDGHAQAPPAGAPPSHRISLVATSRAAVTESNSLIARMLQAGELTSVRAQNDQQITGRQLQTLQQVYKGLPVEGGSVSLQTAGPTTVSVFGTLYSDISMDTTPALTSIDAAHIAERAANAAIAFGATPKLIIVPSPVDTFVLAYKATAETLMTYYVDAQTGEILRVVDERNYEVGVGTGSLGDQKKVSTIAVGSTYRTKDTLRPATISTFDTGGNASTLARMELGGLVTDADLASNPTNTWTNGYVVDAHTNTGLTYDYFYRQHNWGGLDGNNRPMSAIVHSGLINNAYFLAAPFGPNGDGEMVFGRTTANAPVTALDVAGHELMHGVTSFALNARTGTGLLNVIYTVLGPTSFVYNGTTFTCSTTVFVDSAGVRRPPFCSNGRFVLGGSHGGALNEALSDIFGTSVEFFFQPPGSGPLKADYLGGEDVPGLSVRSLSDPASRPIPTDTGSIGYPDHLSKMLNYLLIAASGPATNPTSVTISGIAFSNGTTVSFFNSGTDSGGVHYNSSVFSHAFYLAIEGGINATSGLSVTGVGARNRALVEKVFFRAITKLMPNSPSFTTAASVVIQASIDLYGANSAVTDAVTQAMIAVGLR